jgi:hypothetical protein
MEITMFVGGRSLALCRPGCGRQRHLVGFQNLVAPIGTDMPVSGRMRVSAPEP